MKAMLLLLTFIVLFSAENIAQRTCAFYQCLQQEAARNPSLQKRRKDFEQQQLAWQQQRRNGMITLPDTLFIPVVCHVLWHQPTENIAEEQITSQIRILNEDFNALNADTVNTPPYFQSLRGKTHFYFQLARQTPDGEPSDGIVRKYTPNENGFSLNGAVNVSALGGDDAWDPRYYVNLWVCNMESASGTFAATYFPGGSGVRDGIQCDYHYVGTGGITKPPYNRGRTITHEMGHYFNLDHPWGGTDITFVPYCGDDDHVEDTPPQGKANYGCPAFPKSSCHNYSDMFMSYMDYVDDGCMNLFSKGQAERMLAAYYIMTPNLRLSKALQKPLVFAVDAGIKSILYPDNNSYTCSGKVTPAVVLRNYGTTLLQDVNIRYGIRGEVAHSKSLAHLRLSPQQNDTILLGELAIAQKGSVTLYAETVMTNDSPDSGSANNLSSIAVNNNSGVGAMLPLAEDFSGSFPPKGWSVINPDHLFAWTPTTGSQLSGYAPSVMMDNIECPFAGKRDYLVLPPLDLSAGSHPVLVFDHAFQLYKYNRPQSDSLEVLVSVDCGAHWQRIYYKGGKDLSTVHPPQYGYLSPDTEKDWQTTVLSLDAFKAYPNVLLEFVNTSGKENLLYLDNVKVMEAAPMIARNE